MTNEKDREEAEKMACVLAEHGGDSDFGHAAFVNEIARIRAEAVQAERERCADLAVKYMESAHDPRDWHRDGLSSAILSDDQEANRG